MPGSSAFVVPPGTLVTSWGAGQSNQWQRGIPYLIGADGTTFSAPTGIADFHALEAMTPPTLRTAYSIYGLSIAWGADIAFDAAVTSFIIELALLVNGEVKWVGTDQQPPTHAGTLLLASGVINADLVNPVMINPRERLSLRVGGATSPAATGAVTGALWVANQITFDGTSYHQVFVQSAINYNILDLPGNRSL